MILLYLLLIPSIINNFNLKYKTGKTGILLHSSIYGDGACEQRHKRSILYSHKFSSLIKIKGVN
jgi:hypothetical protein|tara:strand:+ start:1195 stop:1386 length:192 start_codon:yes stop_codon:yes gene_type:complete